MRTISLLRIAGVAALFLSTQVAPAAEGYDPWPGLVQDIFNNRPMNDGANVIGIEMPVRAEDAAIVPVTLRTKLSPGDDRRVRSITLVIDRNGAIAPTADYHRDRLNLAEPFARNAAGPWDP